MPNITIPVPNGILGHNRVYNEVTIREPTFREFIDIGDVTELMIYPQGARIPTINPATLQRYIEACLVEPSDPVLIEQGGYKLARALRDAVLGFFRDEPEPETGPTGTSPKTSSGDAARDGSAPAT